MTKKERRERIATAVVGHIACDEGWASEWKDQNYVRTVREATRVAVLFADVLIAELDKEPSDV